jgi:hypothetical protein
MKSIFQMLLRGLLLWLLLANLGQAQGFWHTREPMPTARWGLGAAEVNGKIYAVGGSYVGVTGLSIVEEYDPYTNSWVTKTPMTTARNAVAVVALNGKIYAIGGGGSSWSTNIVEEYDPELDAWITRQPMQVARGALTAAAVNGKICAIGGHDGTNALNIIEEYDPILDTWTTKTPMPTAREWLASAVVDGKIYVIGGMLSSHYATDTVEVYDPLTDSWTTAQSMPTPRGGLSAAALNGKIYAIGGSTGFPLETNTSVNIVEEYDVNANNWRTVQSMSIERTHIGPAVSNGLVFAIGGTQNTSQAFDIVEAYNPSDLVYIPPIRTCLSPRPLKGFKVPVKVKCVTSTTTINAPIEWDNDNIILDSVGVANTACASWILASNINNDSNKVYFGLFDQVGDSLRSGWDTTIAYLYFRYSGACSYDSISISFDTTYSDDPEKKLLFGDNANPPNEFVPAINFDAATILTYIAGDVNMSCGVNALDITYLINYLYKGGIAPNPECMGDVNGSGSINALDVTYMINYLYKNGAIPFCACGFDPAIRPLKPRPSGSISAINNEDNTTVELASSYPLSGLEMTLKSINGRRVGIKNMADDFELFYNQEGDLIKLGMFNMTGSGQIPVGTTTILEIDGAVEIISVLGADDNAEGLSFEIVNNADKAENLPVQFALMQNRPNPFNPITEISFSLPQACDATLEVYNIAGQKVAILVDGALEAGEHTVQWDSRDKTGQTVASGIYLYRLTAGEFTDTKKMALLK